MSYQLSMRDGCWRCKPAPQPTAHFQRTLPYDAIARMQTERGAKSHFDYAVVLWIERLLGDNPAFEITGPMSVLRFLVTCPDQELRVIDQETSASKLVVGEYPADYDASQAAERFMGFIRSRMTEYERLKFDSDTHRARESQRFASHSNGDV